MERDRSANVNRFYYSYRLRLSLRDAAVVSRASSHIPISFSFAPNASLKVPCQIVLLPPGEPAASRRTRPCQ